MPIPFPTVDEAIATIRKSGLPTVITEGSTDYAMYRRLEKSLGVDDVNFMPVGGRRAVLEAFSRRNEVGAGNVAFIADRDLWVLGDVPDEFKSPYLVFTNGYSIENDLIRDGEVTNFLSEEELPVFEAELDQVINWYSCQASRAMKGEDSILALNISRLLGGNEADVERLSAELNYSGPDESLRTQLLADPLRLVRGKTVLDLLTRQLSATNRRAKFSKQSLLEIGAARGGPYLAQTKIELAAAFGE